MATLPTILRWIACFFVGHTFKGANGPMCGRCGCYVENWRQP